jgi:MazG family protein
MYKVELTGDYFMDPFDSLLLIAEQLLGPDGCPWDRKQTFLSLQPYVLEEAHEVIEAVDADDDAKIIEELGDLLYTIIFYAKLAEKSGRFSIVQVVNAVREKLIRRHPHVFTQMKVEGEEEIVKNWEKIKAQEKAGSPQTSILDGIPPTLPAAVRAQKVLKKLQRVGSSLAPKQDLFSISEEEIGEGMLALILRAENSSVDAESALRRSLLRLEENFRQSEQKMPLA